MSFIKWVKTPLGMGTVALAAYYLYTETSKGKDIGDELYGAGQKFFEEGKHFATTTFDTVIDTGEKIFKDSSATASNVVSTATSTFSELAEDAEDALDGFMDNTVGFNGGNSNSNTDDNLVGFIA